MLYKTSRAIELAVRDNELIVGNDKLDVGDSKVASFGGCQEERLGGLQSHIDKGPDKLALLRFSGLGCRHKNI